MTTEIQSPFQQFFDLAGKPLDSGYIYYGVSGLNPETNPVAVYWDMEGTIAASLPIRTIAGYPARAGAPAPAFVNGAYSITIKDKSGALVAQRDRVIAFAPPSTITAYGGAGDNVTDNSAAFLAADVAQAAGAIGYIVLPYGTFYCNQQVYKPVGLYVGPGKVRFGGDGALTDATIYDAPTAPSRMFSDLSSTDRRGVTFTSGGAAGKGLLAAHDYSTAIGDRALNNEAGFLGRPTINVGVTRATAVGTWALGAAENATNVDAFGASAGQHHYGDRNLMMGNNAGKWMGTRNAPGTRHDFFNPLSLSVWVAKGFETQYPNIRADLDGTTASTYSGSPKTPGNLTAFGNVKSTLVAATVGDVAGNTAIARDALIHLLLGDDNTATGYKAGAQMATGSNATFVGRSAGEGGIWHDRDFIGGAFAAYQAAATVDTVIIGNQAANKVPAISTSVVLGSKAMYNSRDVTGHAADVTFEMQSKTDYKITGAVVIGYGAAQDANFLNNSIIIGTLAAPTASSRTNTLWIGDQVIGPVDYAAIMGNLANNRVGINRTGDRTTLNAQFTVTQGLSGVNPNAGADGGLFEALGKDTGITIGTDATHIGGIFFGRPLVPTAGRVSYDHATDIMSLSANTVKNVSVGAATLGFYGHAAASQPSGVAATAAAIITALQSIGIFA